MTKMSASDRVKEVKQLRAEIAACNEKRNAFIKQHEDQVGPLGEQLEALEIQGWRVEITSYAYRSEFGMSNGEESISLYLSPLYNNEDTAIEQGRLWFKRLFPRVEIVLDRDAHGYGVATEFGLLSCVKAFPVFWRYRDRLDFLTDVANLDLEEVADDGVMVDESDYPHPGGIHGLLEETMMGAFKITPDTLIVPESMRDYVESLASKDGKVKGE